IAVADAVAQVIERHGTAGTPVRAVMLERLGPNVWHDTPAAAMATLEELEETARLVCLARTLPRPLTEAQIDELRTTFGARWGFACPNSLPTSRCSIRSTHSSIASLRLPATDSRRSSTFFRVRVRRRRHRHAAARQRT